MTHVRVAGLFMQPEHSNRNEKGTLSKIPGTKPLFLTWIVDFRLLCEATQQI